MTKIKANEIFELKDLDKKWKWVARDKNGSICLYETKPKKDKEEWDFDDDCFIISYLFNDLELDFGTDDWTKCIAEIPVDYSKYIGKLGIFVDYEEELNSENKNVCILYSVDNKSDYKFVDVNGFGWKYFRPLTKEEIEQLTNYGEKNGNNGTIKS